MDFKRFRVAASLAVLFCASSAPCLRGQQVPVALPTTISTLAGGAASITAGTACKTDASLTATDSLGDGCAGTSVGFSSDIRGGVAVDPLGNVWVADTSNSAIRVINARSGIVTLGAGRGVACSAKTDNNGDGCAFASTVFSSSPRGIATDPWGNVLIAGYGSGLVQVLCNAVSPLCPNTAGNHLLGNMYAVAGCVATATSAGTNGTSADGGIALPTGTCSSSVTELNQPRGVTADRYGNVFIADTGSARYRVVVGPATFNGVTNPMAAVIALNPTYAAVTAVSAAGHIYGILGGYTSPTSGAACVSGSSTLSTDALGDGCPYFVSSTNSSTSSAQGVTVDAAGDVIFTPSSDGRVRVLYMGGAAMSNIITLNNTVTTPVVGSIYSIAGGGTTTPSATPVLSSKVSLDSNIYKVAAAPDGDIYVGDSTAVLYLDGTTGYIRKLFSSGSVCAAASDTIGDGCAAGSSTFGGSNGLGVALDSLGNLYLADATNSRIREVAATTLLSTAVGSTSTQNLLLHNSAASSATTLAAPTEISLGSAACGSVNGDNTVDCTVPVTFTPAQPGLRTAAVATSGAASGTLALSGTAVGSALTIDTASPTVTSLGGGIQPSGVAVSGSRDIYTVDAKSGSYVLARADGTVAILTSGAPVSSVSLAVSPAETLYAVGSSSTSIAVVTPGANGAYTAGTLAYKPSMLPAAPRAVAVDANDTVYVYDATNQAIYRLPTSAIAASIPTVLGTGYTSVVGLALDPLGNLYVADAGAKTIFRIAANGTQTIFATGVTPAGIAVDAGGTVYVQDSATGTVVAYPVSGPPTTLLANLTTPAGLAVDGAGIVYSADSAGTAISVIARNSVSYDFGVSTTGTLAGTLGNAGNLASTGFAQTDGSDFALVAGASNGCTFSSTALAKGGACTFSALFTPTGGGTGAVTDVLTLLPASSAIGALTLDGTKTGTSVSTTTTVTNQAPTGPVYSATGTEVSFTVSVTPSSGTVAGTVNVSIDGGTGTAYTLSGGAVVVPLSGLSAGSHTIAATYPSQSGIVGSSSSSVAFSIAQATTSVTWTPGAMTQQVSRAIGTAVLNASSNGVAGAFVYTATGIGGMVMPVDAATYLPIGTYALSASFTPTDSTDYSGSSAALGSYTVTQAATTSMVGATTNVVASDGSGNYTTLSAAAAALPSTGGTIYLAPGTYTGQVTIFYPNVSLRGLGGDATKVIITAEAGASPGAQNGGKSGDEGSSTLNIDKTTIGSTTYTPNNFYAENLTVNNTWNTDTSYNPSAQVSSSGNCVTNTSQLANSTLFNAGTLCYSQALAVWITSDKAVFNSVRLNSLQDTLYAGSQGVNGAAYTPARQYFWQGYISGDVDYIFGDAALVFDRTQFYTAWHGTTATGTETISAQNKKVATGSPNDYLSGYVMNSCVLTSQSAGMTNLYLGRPYGQFSTHILLNTEIDQVNPLGWIEFSGQTNLPTSTYAEYNSLPYTDAQGNTGQGVAGPRETTSIAPQVFATAAQAARYAPVTFLGTAVNGDSWDPTAALATQSNAFVPSTTPSVTAGNSITILYRPQTPGAGIIPTGAYTIYDNGAALASGSLDASGSAYYTTSSLPSGANNLTVSYAGDANFAGSTSAAAYVLNLAPSTKATAALGFSNSSNPVYGTTVIETIGVSGSSGGATPTGTVMLTVDGGTPQSLSLNNGAAMFSLAGLSAGVHALSAVYNGDATYNSANAMGGVSVAKAPLTVTAASQSIAYGATPAAYTATYVYFVNGDTALTALSGAPSLTTTPASPATPGMYTITAAQGTLIAANYNLTFVNGMLIITQPAQATAVATGDTRSVTEPTFPAVCTTLSAALKSVNDDIPASVDADNTNPDGARIQAALNACTSGQAVELAADGTGNNAFLTGPISMPSNVTLLVDPGVTMYGSRNAQDYDTVPGTHTCGTVNNSSATSSCLPLILINGAQNVGVMGYGKIDGRGGDVVLNAFPSSYAGQTWWGLSTIANSGGSQQNPRMIQLGKASNITFYKITLKNSTLFHISTTSTVTGLTAWDIKIVTPTSSRNTDGIDPGNATNVTVTHSYVSDGDDNIAVGASGSTGSANISITNNHFYAGHGESIGSYTSGGVNNVLFDSNMLSGNASTDSNSTGIRIKSANDRGGVVSGIQYSNSCLQNHKTLIQFTPLYNTDTGTETPNFNNILLQNLTFLTEGTVQLTGASNNGTVYPLTTTFDNVGFATLTTSDLNTAPSNTIVTLGPGQVSTNFVTAIKSFAGANGVTVNDNRSVSNLLPPVCSFTNIAPELTGPQGTTQTIAAGQSATAVVILTPTVASSAYPYPTGTVTLTDENGNQTTATLAGTGDTVQIPLAGLAAGTHTFTASYSGDTVYVPAIAGTPYVTFGSYQVVVVGGSATTTTTTLQGIPTAATYGTAFTATATVAGGTDGAVQFLVNGAVYASSAIAGGTAQASFNLPVGAYTLSAQYTGGTGTAASSSAAVMVAVGPAATSTALISSSSTTTVGVQVKLTATVTSTAGVPTGTVTFASSINGAAASPAGSATLTNGVANLSANLPLGTDTVTATYVASGSFASSASSPQVITVNPPPVVPLPAAPIALPYTVSTVAGGATSATANTACAGSTDNFGNGCQASQIAFNGSSADLRSVVADPFGNLYITDANASQVRRIAPSGIITNFAGYVSGTACLPTATTPCTATLVKLNKPRGVFSDSAGNIFIGGYSDNKVYEVRVADGLLYLVAGNGTKPTDPTGNVGDGMTATSANLNQPRGVAADTYGNLYIADTADNRIRQVDTSGNIQTVVGNGVSSSTGDNGVATAATVSNPQGVLTDPSDNLYIADASRVRVVCNTCVAGSGLYNLLIKLGVSNPTNGYIYTLAGTGSGTYNYTAPALANTVNVAPQKLAMDASTNLYISDSNGVAWFVDAHTGYIRLLAGKGTGCSSSTVGDGCPGAQASFGTGSGGGIGVGVDLQGNAYVADTLNARIRKISTGLSFAAAVTGSTTVQTVVLHLIAGDTLGATTVPLVSRDFTLGTPNCVINPDTTQDCTLSANFSPQVPGARSAALGVTSSLGNTAALALTGAGIGASATLDPAMTQSIGSSLTPAAIAVDGQGNVWIADTASRKLLRYAAGSSSTTATPVAVANLVNPTALAVDARGYAYVADSSGTVTGISPSGVSAVVGTFGAPTALATDSLTNLYVADKSTAAIYEISPNETAVRRLIGSGLTSPSAVTLDASGNLYVADSGSIYRYAASTVIQSTVSTAVAHPGAIAVDAAGNLIVGDTSANTVVAIPASAGTGSFVVASSIAPNVIALDGAGNIYTSANGGSSVLELLRTQAAGAFAGPTAAAQSFTLLSIGNQPLSVSSLAQTDTSDFTLSAAASNDCSVSGGTPTAIVTGGGCSLAAAYAPSAYGSVADTVTFNGNQSNTAIATPANLLQLTLTGQNTPVTTSLVLAGPTPASPVLGQTVSFTATVTAAAGTAAGTVTLTVDGKAGTPVSVTGAAATLSLPGLTAGNHTVSASFTGGAGFANSSAAALTFVVQATPTLTLTVSPAIAGGSVLQGTSQAFAATLTNANAPTGKVAFYDGSTLLQGSISLSTAGVATFTNTTLAPGSHSITAQFAADANNTAATSAALVFTTKPSISAGFTTTTASVSLTVPRGQSGTVSLSYSPNTLYAGTLTFSCSGQPSTVVCSFVPASLTFQAGSSASQSTFFTVSVSPSYSSLRITGGMHGTVFYAVLLPGLFSLLVSRRKRSGFVQLLVLISIGCGAAFITGCGGTTPPAPVASSFTVAATDGVNTMQTTVHLTVQ